jgi:hypothetical protein
LNVASRAEPIKELRAFLSGAGWWELNIICSRLVGIMKVPTENGPIILKVSVVGWWIGVWQAHMWSNGLLYLVPEEIDISWGQFKSEESIMHIIIWEVKTRVCDRGCLKGDQLQMNTFAGVGDFNQYAW